MMFMGNYSELYILLLHNPRLNFGRLVFIVLSITCMALAFQERESEWIRFLAGSRRLGKKRTHSTSIFLGKKSTNPVLQLSGK